MSIFTKPLPQLDTADLQELLSDAAVENARLEFKLQAPSKDDTLKKLSSFANTFGGFMVVGAKADSADGRIQDLPGIAAENSYRQRLVQWCFDGASPPLVVEVSDPIPVPAGNGNVCYVVYTAESDVAPHFLNGRKGVWVRTDEFSARFEARLADENELRHLLDRRKLILDRRAQLLERARRRFDTYAAKTHTDRAGNAASLDPVLEFGVAPRFPARQLCRQEQLIALIQKGWTPWRGVVFPSPHSPTLSQHESAIVLNAAGSDSIFEIDIWGTLFYAQRIGDTAGEFRGIHLYGFLGYVLLFIRHAAKMLGLLGYSGPIIIDVVLGSVLEQPWLHALDSRFGVLPRPGSVLDDEVTFSIPTTSEELRQQPDKIAAEILRYVLFAVNSFDLINTPEALERLIRTGYGYNSWQQPPALRM